MLLIRAIATVRPNLSIYFTLKTFFPLFYITTFSKVLISVHLFYNLLYLNNNNNFLILYFYFVLIFLSFLLYLSFFLCSYLISQRLGPTIVLLLLLSSSFHYKLLLPFLTVKSPPFTSIFFFLFLSW